MSEPATIPSKGPMDPVLDARLSRIERLLDELVSARQTKDYYEIAEFARLVGKKPFTVRGWSRNQRIHAEKRRSGHGRHAAWVVSHEELLRYRREGLLPDPHVSRRPA